MYSRSRFYWAALLGAASALILVSCASPPAPSASESTRTIADAAPPAPPPMLPSAKMAAQGMGYAGIIAQAPGRLAGNVDREKYPEAKSNPVKSAIAEPVSTFSIDVDTASYANVRRYLNDGVLPPKDAVRIEELINYFDYDYALPTSPARPFETIIAMAPSPWGAGKTLLHIGLQGYDVRPAARPPLNLVLLIDTSGSMNEPDKLPLVKKAMRLLVDQLTAKDHVSIVVYAGSAGVVLEPTDGDQKARILAALDQLSAGGSTAGGEGIALAYTMAERHFDKNGVNRIIQATDGDFNVGIADPKRLEDFVSRKRDSGVYLTELGFGEGNYNDLMMQKLAQAGNGIAAYIDTLAEARKVLHDQMQSAMLPIADDVKIQIEFNPAQIAEYRLIGYETRLLNREDFNNDKVDAGEIGAGATVTAIYELTPVGGKTLIDPLRYQPAQHPQNGAANEIAFAKIRYKRPGEKESVLIERPIGAANSYATLTGAPESTRFAAAVAAYGQLLRGDPYLDKSYGWDEVLTLAQGARGKDPFGWRAEFVQLIRAAAAASAAPVPEKISGLGR